MLLTSKWHFQLKWTDYRLSHFTAVSQKNFQQGCHQVLENSDSGQLKTGVNLPCFEEICSAWNMHLLNFQLATRSSHLTRERSLVWWWSGGCEVGLVCSRRRPEVPFFTRIFSAGMRHQHHRRTCTSAAAIRHGKGKRANWPFGEIIGGIVAQMFWQMASLV